MSGEKKYPRKRLDEGLEEHFWKTLMYFVPKTLVELRVSGE
jgi:hypothetical protein